MEEEDLENLILNVDGEAEEMRKVRRWTRWLEWLICGTNVLHSEYWTVGQRHPGKKGVKRVQSLM